MPCAEPGFRCVEDEEALSTCSEEDGAFWSAAGRGFLRLSALGGTSAAQGWVELNQRRRVSNEITAGDTFAKGLFRTGTNNAASDAFVGKAFGLPCSSPSRLYTASAGTFSWHAGSIPFDGCACELVLSPAGAASIIISLELHQLELEDAIVSIWDPNAYRGAFASTQRRLPLHFRSLCIAADATSRPDEGRLQGAMTRQAFTRNIFGRH